jgi:hypothetical protein
MPLASLPLPPYRGQQMHRVFVSVLAVCLVGALVVPAHGQPATPRQAVDAARRGLGTYDLTGSATTRIIAELGKVAPQLPAGTDRREALFLRAMAAADLVIIAARRGDTGLFDRVAAAWGTEATALVPSLIRSLQRLRKGVYAAAAGDAVAALRVAHAMRTGAPAPWQLGAGLRSHALFLGSVRDAVALKPDDALTALAALGTDPCAQPQDPTCTPVVARFDVRGRAAVGTLQAASDALRGLQGARERGDPFARALRAELAADGEALARAVLTPLPRFDEAPSVAEAPETMRPLDADLVLTVHEAEVRYGWAPKVRLAPNGVLELVARGEPVLPEVARVTIPRDFRPAIQPIDALREALAKLAPDGARLAVAANDRVLAHVLARVLRSAVAAGLTPVMLVGAAPNGAIVGAPIVLRDARQGVEGSPDASIFVRLGGYTVRTRQGRHDVPRVRDADGLRFDVAGLTDKIGSVPPRSAAVEFMTAVAAGPVSQAVFRVANAREPVQLVIP